ncbi:putative bifunctional diguanylate cyclase/phosphodiesterase [Caloramator sp. E03]|uniref:putative bifunctional diguanylate cyclase/phosphodiesterase n=1 Tax=Caloramator sp. E03 TaxID=2576307 RepID=UPI00143DB9B3|nr:bifunctional diguanylate cyclase/phosphodiesterase [Caloramator sp. E03]
MGESNLAVDNFEYIDPITNVYNKYYLEKFYKDYKDKIIGLAILDFDNFKYINDTYGHIFGDKVLILLAQKLKKLNEDKGFIVRFSGDKFIVLYVDRPLEEINESITKIIDEFEDVFEFEGKKFLMTVSAGIYLGKPNEDLYEIIRRADVALNYSKRTKVNKMTVFEGILEEKIVRKTKLMACLKKALEDDEFYLVYQPIYDINLERIYEVEALARWKNKEFGEVPPVEFIPILEETGLIIDFGYAVLEKVFRQIKEWENMNINLTVNINISPVQISDMNFIEKVKSLKEKYNIDTNRIVFEITETQLIKADSKKRQIIKKLQELGISLALDDYGSDYSQINNVIKIPAKYIKISKEIVDLISEDYRVKLMIKCFIDLFNSLGYLIVAEGIESMHQFEYLKEIGCHKIQGYYISRPVDKEEIVKLVKHN